MAVTQDPQAWARLGIKIRETRERLGYSRKQLSEIAGVSEKSIQVAEEGRKPRARWPQSLTLIEEAIGWRRGSMQELLERKYIDDNLEPSSRPRTPSGFGEKTYQLDMTAEGMFIRQMRRRRRALGLSPKLFAEKASACGMSLTDQEVIEIESGLRPLGPADAEPIARALGVDAGALLSSALIGPDQAMKAPPTEEELTAEVKAMERRIFEAGVEVNHSMRSLEAARQRMRMEEDTFYQITARKAELEHHYHYLLGRIDAVRASRGDKEITTMEVHFTED